MNFNILNKYGYSVTEDTDKISIKLSTKYYHYIFVVFIFLLIWTAVLGAELAEGPFLLIQLIFFTFMLFMPLYFLFIRVNKRIIIYEDSIELKWPWVFGPNSLMISFSEVRSLELKKVKNKDQVYYILLELPSKKRKTLLVFNNTSQSDLYSVQLFATELAAHMDIKNKQLAS